MTLPTRESPRPRDAEALKSCPFCGATPHRGPGKVQRDQLHGEPFQNFSIWCPHDHAKITALNERFAREAWNTRALTRAEGGKGNAEMTLVFAERGQSNKLTTGYCVTAFGKAALKDAEP